MSIQKQKLSQMVLKKMKQKKQAQQRNRPHYQLLRLDIKFSLQQHINLKQSLQQSNKKLSQQSSTLQQLKQHLQQLQNTGKKPYPFIILKPEFIASQHIKIQIKDFYRKTTNTFLKANLIKKQKYQNTIQNQQKIIQKIHEITQKEIYTINQQNKNIKIKEKKRVRNLKQDLTRKSYIQQTQQIQTHINKLKQDNQSLLSQYQLKKVNYQSRFKYSQLLNKKIQQEKHKIQSKFNPITYRNYLKKIFDIRIKNQYMEKNLNQVIININKIKKTQQNYQKQLQKKCKNITFYGKVANSPSKVKGKLQKTIQKQQRNRCHTNPKNITQFMFHSMAIQNPRLLSSARSQPKLKASSRTSRNKSIQKSQKSINNKLQNQQQQQHYLKSISKNKKNSILSNNNNYNSLKTLKNSIKSQRTMSTTLRTINTSTKKGKYFQ